MVMNYDDGDDYRLFYRGEKLESIEQDKLYFPDFSHAQIRRKIKFLFSRMI